MDVINEENDDDLLVESVESDESDREDIERYDKNSEQNIYENGYQAIMTCSQGHKPSSNFSIVFNSKTKKECLWAVLYNLKDDIKELQIDVSLCENVVEKYDENDDEEYKYKLKKYNPEVNVLELNNAINEIINSYNDRYSDDGTYIEIDHFPIEFSSFSEE